MRTRGKIERQQRVGIRHICARNGQPFPRYFETGLGNSLADRQSGRGGRRVGQGGALMQRHSRRGPV